MKKWGVVVATVLLAICASAKAQNQNILAIQGTANLPGHFLGAQTVLVDKNAIYAVSDTAISVIDGKSLKHRSYSLPSGVPTAISWCDALKSALCVSSNQGSVYKWTVSKNYVLKLQSAVSISPYGLQSISQTGPSTYVGVGQTSSSTTSSYILMSGLNEGDYVQELTGQSLGQTYGLDFTPNVTRVFDRSTGMQKTSWENPADLFGRLAAVNVFTSMNGAYAWTTTPGCCGPGISVYDLNLGVPDRIGFINRPYANAVASAGGYIFVGGEDGVIDVWSNTDPANPVFVKGISIREMLGAAELDAFEIRSLSVSISGKSFVIYGATSSTYGTKYPNLIKLVYTP